MSRTLLRVWRRGFCSNIRFALTALVSHKLRSGLTILVIVVGVATVIGMVSAIEGFQNDVREAFESFGATLVQFQKFDPMFGPGERPSDEERRRRKNLTYEDAVALKALCPSMKAVSPERYWFSQPGEGGAPGVLFGGQEATPDLLVGVTEDYPAANNRAIGSGRFVTEADVRRKAPVTVIGHAIAETLFPNSDALGEKVTIGGRRYVVVGVMEQQPSTFFESTDAHVYLPITTFDSHFPFVKRFSGVNIATIPKKPQWVGRITEEGVAVLRSRRGVRFDKPNDFGIMTPDKLLNNFRSVTRGITLAMIFVSGIALLVGGVGVMNIMLVSVTERTSEIGMRKALGAFRRDIVLQFLTEAMTLSGIGGACGVLVGLLIAIIVGAVSPLSTMTPLWSILLGLAVAISVGLFFGIYPASRAARLDPIEALRFE